MAGSERCADTRELLPELALEVLPGKDRARVLAHVSHCAGCRRELTALIDTADELLTLVPPREPPMGLESRVVARIARTRPPAWRRLAVAAAVALVAAAASAGALLLATAEERELGASYRDVLEVADGRYFAAHPLRGPGGAGAGHVFGYAGEHAWVLVVVDRPGTRGPLDVELLTNDGRAVPIGRLVADDGRGGWGGLIPVELREVAGVRLVGDETRLEARFEHSS